MESFILEEDFGNMGIVDTRTYRNTSNLEVLPNSVTGTYVEDYNILHLDETIRKRLKQEVSTVLPCLRLRLRTLGEAVMKEQTFINRSKTIRSIQDTEREIEDIVRGNTLNRYVERVTPIIEQYKKNRGGIKSVFFGLEEQVPQEPSEKLLYRIHLIEEFLTVASEYIHVDVVRTIVRKEESCIGCGYPLVNVAHSDEGTIICPECDTDHNTITLVKSSKDGDRIPISTPDDESIDNFLRAFIRYQGLQSDRPDASLYRELDEYFAKHDRPTGEEIRKLPLNSRGRRGDTNHRMLWNALSQIKKSEYYEDVNLIGHIYWGWTLPSVMDLKESIIDKYNKTQSVFYKIPLDERGRTSSLGTQFRLWRHLQLEGHECYMDEFKIAENPESLRTHNKLWRTMCEGVNDDSVRYIH